MRGVGVAASLFLSACLLIGCVPPEPAATTVDVAAEARAIRDQSAQWLEWARAKDAAAVAEGMFLEDAETIFDGKIHRGRVAILADMEKNQAENPDSTISWSTTRVEVAASGDLAFERGSWTYDPDGDGEKPVESGEYATFWKKVDGVWRCAVDSGSTIKEEEE
ncbi:MAG: nuclear transport factor 2 family protein [Acidobacteriota bacterium]|nr:nuclear transport factor 2 family protein [Acidobacteriota bacterium]